MRCAGLRGLAALPRRMRTTDSRHDCPIAPDPIGRRFEAAAPNPVWLGDLTHMRTGEGWLVLAAVLDLHTRKIVGWSMRETLHAAIALEALGMAVQRQPPAPGLIRHAQQGQPARVRAVPEDPRRGRDHALHEPQGASPRQRPDGALLPPPEGRARPPSRPRREGRGAARPVRVNRGPAQHPSPPLGPGLPFTGRRGTHGAITASTHPGQDQASAAGR